MTEELFIPLEELRKLNGDVVWVKTDQCLKSGAAWCIIEPAGENFLLEPDRCENQGRWFGGISDGYGVEWSAYRDRESKSDLLEVLKIDCPFCNEIHFIEKRKRITGGVVNEKRVRFEEEYFVCPRCAIKGDESEFVNGELLDLNLRAAKQSSMIRKEENG